jgi:hypothetical protein
LPAAARLSAFATRPVAGGVDAASAPSGRRVAALLRSRRPLGCRPRRYRTRPVSKRGRAGGRPFVTGPGRFAARRSLRRTDRLRTSLLRYRIASLRRMPAAPCRPGVPTARTIPLWRLLRPTTPKPWSRRPCGFRASRLACKGVVTCARLSSRWKRVELRRRPRGSFVAGVLQTAHVPGPRSGCSRGLTGAAFASPAAPVGFAATLRSVVPTPRVSAPRRRLGPTCRFARR